jgi:hypothetical protein
MTTTWQLLIWTNMLENDDNPSDLRTSYCQTSPHLWRFAIGSLSLGYLVALPRKSNLVEMAMSSFRQNTTRMVPKEICLVDVYSPNMMVVLTHPQMNVCLLKLPELLPTAALSTSSRASTGHTASMRRTATWKAAAMIKHPCVDGLYHRLKFAKLGMVYYCFTTITVHRVRPSVLKRTI